MSVEYDEIEKFVREEVAVLTGASAESVTAETVLVGKGKVLDSADLVVLLLAAEEYARDQLGAHFDWTSDSAMSEVRSHEEPRIRRVPHEKPYHHGGHEDEKHDEIPHRPRYLDRQRAVAATVEERVLVVAHPVRAVSVERHIGQRHERCSGDDRDDGERDSQQELANPAAESQFEPDTR